MLSANPGVHLRYPSTHSWSALYCRRAHLTANLDSSSSCLSSKRCKHAGSTWGQTGVNLGSTWGQPGVNLGSTWGQPGVNLGSTWGQHGVNLGSTWGQPGVNLHRPTVYLPHTAPSISHSRSHVSQVQGPALLSRPRCPLSFK